MIWKERDDMGLIIGGIVLGGLGLASGINKANAREVEYQENLKDLKTKEKNLTDTFQNNVANVVADLADANKKLEANIADTELMRDRSKSTASQTIARQQDIAAMEMADLQVQIADQLGSANQSLAMSGTRRMTNDSGQVMNAQVFKAERTASSAFDKAKAQVTLNFYSNAENARNSYLQSNLNIAAYQREIEANGSIELDADGNVKYDANGKVIGTGKAARTINSYKLAYDQDISAVREDIKFMENEGRDMTTFGQVMDVVTGLVDGFTSSFRLFG